VAAASAEAAAAASAEVVAAASAEAAAAAPVEAVAAAPVEAAAETVVDDILSNAVTNSTTQICGSQGLQFQGCNKDGAAIDKKAEVASRGGPSP
jgi:cytochrome c5